MDNKQYSIIDVAKDLITGNLKMADADTIAQRSELCNTCDARNAAINTCTVCGCFIPAKVRFQESTCPMELW